MHLRTYMYIQNRLPHGTKYMYTHVDRAYMTCCCGLYRTLYHEVICCVVGLSVSLLVIGILLFHIGFQAGEYTGYFL